ncbi:MAG: hypothetical protein KDD55_09630, partial [Bdellovibrionales bacterium]|nr:hypothetical protein [Bdellovibrionales bacterium]
MFAVVTTLTTLMVALDSGSPFLVSLAILFGSALLMIAGWKREKEYSRVEHLIRHLSPRTHEQEYSLDKLESQIEGLLWEVERLSQGIGVKGQHSSKNADETPHTFEEVVTQQMTTLHERFRSVSSVFCYESEGDISFVRMGIGGTRFESRLQALLVSFFRTGVLDCEGLVDGERSSLQTDLSLFGIRFGIAYPVFWQEQGEEKRGVLWLGYRAEKPPLEVEVSRCRTGASELGEYLTNMLRVSKLSARASHAEETLEQREDYIA